jgi:hypothetical protein
VMLSIIQSWNFYLLIYFLETYIRMYRTITFPVVLYWCEILPLIIREEHKLRVSENRVLKIILGPKRDEVTGGWRKLYNEELCDLYCLPSIIIMIKSR